MLDGVEFTTDLRLIVALAASARRRRGSDDAAPRRLPQPSVRALLSLPVLVAFGLFSSPARAMPAASMQLFRMDGNGVRAVPAISAAIEAVSRPPAQMAAATQATLPNAPIAAADGPIAPELTEVPSSAETAETPAAAPAARPVVPMAQTGEQGVLLAQAESAAGGGLNTLSQTFQGAFPANVIGNIRIVNLLPDGTLGSVVEEIPFNSSRVTLKPLNSQLVELSVQPTTPLQPGQSVMMQLPSTSPTGVPYSFPGHLATTPCTFTGVASTTAAAGGAVAGGAAAAGAAVAGAATATFPVLAVVLGVVVIGGIVAAATGAFNGNGGSNPSSQ